MSEVSEVIEVSEEEDGRGGGGYRTKNKNPTRQCGEQRQKTQSFVKSTRLRIGLHARIDEPATLQK